MSGHVTTVVPTVDSQWVGQCSCRARSKIEKSHWDAQKWTFAHASEIARIRTHLSGRAPSMKDQRDYYASKAQDDAIPAAQRRLWAQLADELTRRLGENERAADQPQLF